jgi:hypothetical protein
MQPTVDSPQTPENQMSTFTPDKEPRSTELVAAHEEITNLRFAMRTRSVIDQAKGILMAQSGCTADEAFAMLRSASMRDNRKLRDVAAAIVSNVVERGARRPGGG